MDPEAIYDQCLIYKKDIDGSDKIFPCDRKSPLKNGKCNFHQQENIDRFIRLDSKYIGDEINRTTRLINNAGTIEKKAYIWENLFGFIINHKYVLYTEEGLGESFYNAIIKLMDKPIYGDIIEFDYYLDQLFPLRNEFPFR
jgi:hypothetical protein